MINTSSGLKCLFRLVTVFHKAWLPGHIYLVAKDPLDTIDSSFIFVGQCTERRSREIDRFSGLKDLLLVTILITEEG